ncbi:hypothetical protein [Amycolatopsis sp. cmx-11-32]|uniref:hypothetical protein n=1 Tax=Amycolatopsis sp. cmx-11-32 TaxID=2785796 RepID=UPI0039E407CE
MAPYHLQAVALMARAVPDGVRAQAMSLTSMSSVTARGIGIMPAGGLGQLTGPFVAVGVAATVAVASAGPMAMAGKLAIGTGPDMWLPAGSRTGKSMGSVLATVHDDPPSHCSICVFRN